MKRIVKKSSIKPYGHGDGFNWNNNFVFSYDIEVWMGHDRAAKREQAKVKWREIKKSKRTKNG